MSLYVCMCPSIFMITTSYYNTIVAAQGNKSAHAGLGVDADNSDDHKPELTRRWLILILRDEH